MAFKQFVLDGGTPVTVYKRKASRSLRLSISSKGEVRVSIPVWSPYSAGLQFAESRSRWINEQRLPDTLLIDGQAVGKAHHLKLLPVVGAQKLSNRVINGHIFIKYPAELSPDDAAVQALARTACVRALRTQAEQLLPQRLADLARKHDFSYKDVAIKDLKSRWGSCDHINHIVLNLFLMQLPWELIDYVLLHELTHTKYLHHGPEFWAHMKSLTPYALERKRSIKNYHPILLATIPLTATDKL